MKFEHLVTQDGPNVLRLRLIRVNSAKAHFGDLTRGAATRKFMEPAVSLDSDDDTTTSASATASSYLPVSYYFSFYRCKGLKWKFPLGHCFAKPFGRGKNSRNTLLTTPFAKRDRIFTANGYRVYSLRHAHVAIALELMETFNRAMATTTTTTNAHFDTSFFRSCLATIDDASEAFFLRILHGGDDGDDERGGFDRDFVAGFRAQRNKLVAILEPQTEEEEFEDEHEHEDDKEIRNRWFLLYLSTLEAHLVWGTMRQLASEGRIVRPEEMVYLHDGFAAKLADGQDEADVVAASNEHAARNGFRQVRWQLRPNEKNAKKLRTI